MTLHDLLSASLAVWAEAGLGRVLSMIYGFSASNWWTMISQGLSYSLPLLTILTAHEFGHYFSCRRTTWTRRCPISCRRPVPLTGTFGAVIRIKERVSHVEGAVRHRRGRTDCRLRRAAAVPDLGMALSDDAFHRREFRRCVFGEPLLSKAAAWLTFGPLPEGLDIFLHPMGFAAWFGMLATALNLLPFGQLDGGHISYAVFGAARTFRVPRTRSAPRCCSRCGHASWISMAVIMLAMALFLGLRHPQVSTKTSPSTRAAKLCRACWRCVIFVLCFTPVPIEFFFGSRYGARLTSTARSVRIRRPTDHTGST